MDYIGKGEMLINSDVNQFVHMEHFWDLSFQLMKHGTNTLHVALDFIENIHCMESARIWSNPCAH